MFKYLCVVDFEATCWQGHFHTECEIIEFPAVLFNLETGTVEEEFQQYCFPVENPKLSYFCIKLTGIKQDQVDNGVPLGTCLMQFNQWIKKILKERRLVFPKFSEVDFHGNIAMMTWSDWDFEKCLKQECSRKHLKRPSYFNQWIDLRVIYANFLHYHPKSFADALNHVGLEFEGHQHCGLHDARNIAKLAWYLYKQGAKFHITKDLLPEKNLNFKF
ncbi:RNA-binding region-containing protein 3 [Sergentomyia squamirostris]